MGTAARKGNLLWGGLLQAWIDTDPEKTEWLRYDAHCTSQNFAFRWWCPLLCTWVTFFIEFPPLSGTCYKWDVQYSTYCTYWAGWHGIMTTFVWVAQSHHCFTLVELMSLSEVYETTRCLSDKVINTNPYSNCFSGLRWTHKWNYWWRVPRVYC